MVAVILLCGVGLGVSITLLGLAIAFTLGTLNALVSDYLHIERRTEGLPKWDKSWEQEWRKMHW